jgi:hypothetical protein
MFAVLYSVNEIIALRSMLGAEARNPQTDDDGGHFRT